MLATFDKLEAYPVFYDRQPIKVSLVEGPDVKNTDSEVDCLVYIMTKYRPELLESAKDTDFIECYHNAGPKLYVPPKDRPESERTSFRYDVIVKE